jgi:hypothetical protein
MAVGITAVGITTVGIMTVGIMTRPPIDTNTTEWKLKLQLNKLIEMYQIFNPEMIGAA